MNTEVEEQPKVQKKISIYSRVRALAILSKVCGAFPICNVTTKDGRELRHCWWNLIHLYDLIVGVLFLFWYLQTCNELLERGLQSNTEDTYAFVVWIKITCFLVLARGAAQFLLVHLYAPRLPTFFHALDEYNYGIGRNSVKFSQHRHRDIIFSILWTLFLLGITQMTSYLFFRQFDCNLTWLEMIPVSLSYMMANIWKELPMNMFAKLCINLTRRMSEICDEVRELKEFGRKDLSKELEALRLQQAAVSRLVGLLQSCYGMQVVANILFMIVDTVLQLFIFFVMTFSTNFFLLLLALYYLIVCFCTLVIVEQLERMDGKLLDEIASFEVDSAPQSLHVQIQLFMAQLTAKPTKISGSGFFIINNAALGGILTAVATYLVMMVQFSPYIENKISNGSLLALNNNGIATSIANRNNFW